MRIATLKRKVKYFWQRQTRGFDDSELWSLDVTIARFILPRLKVFRGNVYSYPSALGDIEYGMNEWKRIIDKMILAFELIQTDEYFSNIDPTRTAKIEEGLDLFRKYYFDLWD